MNKPLDTPPPDVPMTDALAGTEWKPAGRLAIALQGGGSHAAFCAGVLARLLNEPELPNHVIGLSGTSGAAHAAAIAWSWIHEQKAALGAARLWDFWDSMKAKPAALFDWGANHLTLTLAQSSIRADVSPYDFPASWWAAYAQDKLRRSLADALPGGDLPTTRHRRAKPYLLIGAAEILTGELRAIDGQEATIEHLLASATLPELFPAHQPRYGNRWDGAYWDGLFSMNPPIAELLDLPGGLPDEIWVVRVNPKNRQELPRSCRDIADRRNELSGNLSLEQEISQLRRVNDIIRVNRKCQLKDKNGRVFKIIEVREIWLDGGQISYDMDLASKMDRSPDFIEQLFVHGLAQADRFLSRLPESVA